MTMKWTNEQLWLRYQQYYTQFPNLRLALDISRMNFNDHFFSEMEPAIQRAFKSMAELEKGAIANGDEDRMVGHYWLRNPALAPNDEIRTAITQNLEEIKQFTGQIKSGAIQGAKGPFQNLLLIGIGGSALGPQFVYHALNNPQNRILKTWFFDNTDPDGMDRVLAELNTELGQTLCIVISKSGGTKETRNGMLEAKAAYEQAGLCFEKHAVAITMADSKLDMLAASEKDESKRWLKRFPMWDWVGGRTSELSAVGLLPAALQGIDISSIIDGAKACDVATRKTIVKDNPAAQLALMWHYSGNGKGSKDMVILPYKDRLELFSRYLQQLIMESLGKETSDSGRIEHQGIAVYGNKGSTDQHAYVQQLRDGIPNFFVTFIEVLKDRDKVSIYVEPNITSGDYLNDFLQGTRRALFEKGRESVTITIDEVSPYTIGVLIALYERAVGYYASLVQINAYHQPGVEAGKKAAEELIQLQLEIVKHLKQNKGKALSVTQIATALEAEGQEENIYKICRHLAANRDRGIKQNQGTTPSDETFTAV